MKTVKKINATFPTNVTNYTTGRYGWLSLLFALVNLFFISTASATPLSEMVKIDTRLYNGNVLADANVVVFDVAYSNAVDGDDANKLSNAGENIAIQRGNSILVVEGRQPAVVNDMIPFRMWNIRQQDYRLEFVAINLITPGLNAMLEDSYLNTSTLINPNGTTSINFTANSNAGSSAVNRFRIVFRQAAILPVTFISISANRTTASVKLNWEVAAEINIRNYEVQRSADGIDFITAGIIAAKANSSNGNNYSLSDATAPSKILFYRIKGVETNGESKYSSIVKVSAGDVKHGFTIVSNPVENGIINLQFTNQQAGSYNIKVINNSGQNIINQSVNHTGGNNNQLINLPEITPPGIYSVIVITPDNTFITKTIMVSNK
jgi:hypothetical protein